MNERPEGERGSRAPALVLLPGMDGTGDLLAPFVAALPRGRASIVARYPPDRRLGYDELLPRVRALLPSRGPFAIVAESFSGPLAIRLAAEAPPGLCALVLVATFASDPLPPALRWLSTAARPVLFRVDPPAAAVRAFAAGSDATDEQVAGLLAALRSVDPAVLAHRLREAIEVDVEARQADVRVPVLYVAGADDRVVLARSFERIRRRLPSVERVVLPAPHLVLFARPREAAREILRFVDGRVGAS